MGSNIDEALRAKSYAEKQFMERNYVGARNYALKAQTLCPELEGISQMVATFGVYIASEAKINGELDYYSILGLDPSAEKSKIKKQYKKMAVLLHPDKNRTIGADGAFRLVSDAWAVLSDSAKRSSYDQKRHLFAGYGTGVYEKPPSSQARLDSFWTVCTSCHVQYEYLRKYVNKRLSCKNCRGVFIAVETGAAPMNGSFPYSSYTHATENGYRTTHGCGMTCMPTATTGYCSHNGHTGHHFGYRSDHGSSISFQGYSSGNSVGVMDHNGLSSPSSSFVLYRENDGVNKTKAKENNYNLSKSTCHVVSNGYTVQESSVLKPKRGRPSKKMKVDFGSSLSNGYEQTSPKLATDTRIVNGNEALKPALSRLSSLSETSIKRPVVDVRQMLIDKARSEIREKLEEVRLTAKEEAEKIKENAEVDKSNITAKLSNAFELKRTASMSITVPDSDFHDFDKDRSEECFKPKQIWALYDEEDGMPRLYCLIREVISTNPFKIHIGYLSSKSDCEFGSVNWLDSGFTKSCGSFRVFHSETVEQVNIFSHLLSREKAGRGGCVKIYPRCGDIWAVYINWSQDWDRTTPDVVRHQYEMVEVLSDYTEENGVWVAPLAKMHGYKTVYRRNPNTSSIRWIARREMLRFSHQVPAYKLRTEGTNLPEGSWDLDPAATPDQLLQGESDLLSNKDPAQTHTAIGTTSSKEKCQNELQREEKICLNEITISTTNEEPRVVEDTGMGGGDTTAGFFLGQEVSVNELTQENGMRNTVYELSSETSVKFLIDLN